MIDIIDMLTTFVSWYHTDIFKGQIISFFGDVDGLLISLAVLWCFIYAIGFAVARHNKTNMDSDDITASFFLGGFVFLLLASILLVGGAIISLVMSLIAISTVLYFITKMVLKGLDARKQIDT